MLRIRVVVTMILIIGMLAFGNTANAIPTLQLDIVGQSSDGDTTYSAGSIFTLQAFLSPNSFNTTSDEYFISVAVVPRLAMDQGGNFGSFAVNGGLPINVTAGMTYGTPPIETLAPGARDSGDLASHGIFETYFTEIAFQFNTANTTPAYNVQDGSTEPGNMYFANFDFNLTNLSRGYELHFDLYNTELRTIASGDEIIKGTMFAPFSHDAESRRVSEPTILALFGFGLMGLAMFSRKKK